MSVTAVAASGRGLPEQQEHAPNRPTIQSMAAQRQAVLASFDRVETDEEGAAASWELHRLNRAILEAPATCAGDITVKLSVFGSILIDYGEMIDGQAALWARLSEDVAAFTSPRMAEAA